MDISMLGCSSKWTPSCIKTECMDNTFSLITGLISIQVFVFAYYRHSIIRQRQSELETDQSDEKRPQSSRKFSQHVVCLPPQLERLELFGLIVNLSTVVIVLFEGSSQYCSLTFAPTVFAIYLLSLRLGRNYEPAIGLQAHSMGLYIIQWICLVFTLPIVLSGRFSIFERIIVSGRLAMFTGLVLFHIASPRIAMCPSENSVSFVRESGREEGSSALSRLTFHWTNSLVWKAFRKTVEASDLYPLDQEQKSSWIIQTFSALTPRSLPMIWRIYHFAKRDFIEQGWWALANGIAVFIPALLMRVILQYLQSPDGVARSTAWFCVGGLLLPGFVSGLADCQCNWIWHKIGAKLRSVLMGEIYGKILRMSIATQSGTPDESDPSDSSKPKEDSSDGNLLNLISADVEIISETLGSVYLVWVTFPVQISIGTYLLYQRLGAAGILGVLMMMAFLPVNILVSRRLMAVQGHMLSASDARLQAGNDILNNIKTIKYYGWEAHFKERVLEKRQTELKRMRTRFIWWSVSTTLFYTLPFIMTSMTLFFYAIVFGNELDSATAFPSLAIFAVLRIPLNRMADAITFLLQTRVSFLRVCEHLDGLETGKYVQLNTDYCPYIGLEDATLAWPAVKSFAQHNGDSLPLMEIPPEKRFRLHNLNIKFEESALNLICGPSGAGKSSLLLALLGELDLQNGRIYIPQSGAGIDEYKSRRRNNFRCEAMAYCPQEPWIQNKTVRANIIMHLPFDSQRYQTVLNAVAMTQDLSILEQGDLTVAGENGSRLSGGQKQRVALARALYSPARYVLLDDSLSALDSTTAKHVVLHGIQSTLMEGRTCVFATHNVELLANYAKHVVILEDGRVQAQGNAKDLISSGFIDVNGLEAKDDTTLLSSPIDSPSKTDPFSETTTIVSEPDFEDEPLRADDSIEPLSTENDHTEQRSTGAVAWSVIQTYLKAMGSMFYWSIVLLGFIVQQLVAMAQAVWMKHWSSQFDMLRANQSHYHELDALDIVLEPRTVASGYYVSIYIAIGLAFGTVTIFRDMFVFHGSLQASSKLYKKLLGSVLHAKFLFFDKVPMGQITNRFSRDIEIIDQSLPPFSIHAIQLAATLLFSVGLIATILPAFLIMACFIFAAYCGVAAIYLNGARDFKRIEAVERSPVYQQFGETIKGRVSIRAYAQTSPMTNHYHTLVDRLNQPYLAQWASKEWLTFRINILSSLISFSTGAFILSKIGNIDAGAAGLALNYASSFTENVMWLVQIYGLIQQDLTSADRVIEYTQIEQEPVRPLKPASRSVPSHWPSEGGLNLKNYTATYESGQNPALKNLTLDIKPHERIGIVGRTGAGKSTLGLALIRGLEAENGYIEVDGVDIASMPLQRLRQSVTLVSQEPKLFSGTLRDNLCPLHDGSDEEMIEAIRVVGILGKESSRAIEHSDLGLPVDTLSRGQQQLVCIARGLLRRSKILILDEATASVDFAADESIQAGLRANAAAGATIIAIAHRLLTVADYDRIVVLDEGQIVEEGTPLQLLSRQGKEAFFRRLCEESGQLKQIQQAALLQTAERDID